MLHCFRILILSPLPHVNHTEQLNFLSIRVLIYDYHLKVRAKMAPFWTRPQRLGYLCLRQVRKSIGPKKLSEDRLLLETLNIPNTMLGYLQLA